MGGRDCAAIGAGTACKRQQLLHRIILLTANIWHVEIAASGACGTPMASQSLPPWLLTVALNTKKHPNDPARR